MVKNTTDRWAVLIGINGYHESLGRLKYSINDCRRLAEVLTTGDDAFPADQVLVLADDEATERRPTYTNIHSWLASWLAQPDEDDTVLVFFAGHGREMDGKCYLVPGDATLQTIHVTGIPVLYIQELLNRCKARQKVLILDACHSGAGRDVSTMAAPMMETLSAGKGIYTMTSCDVDEVSHEWGEKKQGVFSYYLAEALSGSCPPDAHGRITAEAVYEHVCDCVRRWAARKRCAQNPKRVSAGIGSLIIRTIPAQRTATDKICSAIEGHPSPEPGFGVTRPAEAAHPAPLSSKDGTEPITDSKELVGPCPRCGSDSCFSRLGGVQATFEWLGDLQRGGIRRMIDQWNKDMPKLAKASPVVRTYICKRCGVRFQVCSKCHCPNPELAWRERCDFCGARVVSMA